MTLERVGTFADGVAVRTRGRRDFPSRAQYVDEIILVSNDEICAAIQDIFEDNRVDRGAGGCVGGCGLKSTLRASNCRDRSFVASIAART